MAEQRTPIAELRTARGALNLYGNLEDMIRALRDQRPLDLNAEIWHRNTPQAPFDQWRQLARACVLDGMHYNPGKLDLQAEITGREQRDGFVLEHVALNTTPWNRVEGFFLIPDGVPLPVPGLVVFHAWGGPMLFGKERVVNTDRDHPVLLEHRNKVYSGQFLAEVFVRQGYAVIVIDAHHFGARAPRGVNGIPQEYDPFDLSIGEYVSLDTLVREQLYLGVRQLNWAGTTWMGVNFWDDSRCVDYLVSRPEVDAQRIGCTGLSGGGWRTNVLAALDARIKASVSVGWMTTGDYQQIYNLSGAVGTFCLLPGVWDRLDIPDLTIMSAPGASMVVSGQQDMLFPPEAQVDAARQIQLGYEWAGAGHKFNDYRPDKPHCYDVEIQQQALSWFANNL
ncbi:MAG: alpha/beta hydrolase family protein [Anaerolineae bacterium]|nr:alpha/beta hydrolase family protein [Anaerolineae bacterium]